MKKIVVALSALMLLLLPALSAFGGQTVVTEINPFVTGGQRRVTVHKIPAAAGGEFQACDETAYDYNTFKLAVLRRLRQKDTNFTICFQSGYQPLVSEFLDWWDEMDKDQDVPWLSNSWRQVSYNYSYTGSNRVTQSIYTLEYWHDQVQEAELETAVRAQVRQLVTSATDMPTREKTIHDWVVKHVTYDQSLKRHSDYDAFFDGSAVCQGYALLTDRMLAMAGVENKIVIGQAGGVDHAWNMVKLCGNWFQLDPTWDDPTGMGPDYISWDYFNITDNDLGANHSWEWSDYPACTTTYYDGYCQGEVVNGCSIFAPQNCRTEMTCVNASGSWSNGVCSIPGSPNSGGGGGGTAAGFPSTPMNPVVYPAPPSSSIIVTVPSGMVALTPQLSVGSCGSVTSSAIAYIYLPLAHFGLSVPATVACNGGVATISIGTGSLDFSGYAGTYDIYFGYVDDRGVINYNAYELIVE